MLVEEDRSAKTIQIKNLSREDKKEISRLFLAQTDKAKVHRSKYGKARFSKPRTKCYYCSFDKIAIPKDRDID